MHTKRIARGAAWLDKECPNWFEKIDERWLTPDNDSCVLGQLHGDFNTYMKRRYFIPDWLEYFIGSDSRFAMLGVLAPNMIVGVRFMLRFGFNPVRETDAEWREAWVREIRARKQAKLDRESMFVPKEWEKKDIPLAV